MPFVDFPILVSGGDTSHCQFWIVTITNCCMISMFTQTGELQLEGLIWCLCINTLDVQKIDVACVMDRHVIDKHREKAEKYLDLAIELQSLWNSKIEVVPLVFGVLDTIHESTIKSFQLLGLIDINVHQLVKTVLLRTATILRKHFGLLSSS